MQPLIFEPYLRPQIWGNRRLAQLGKALPPQGTFGESWEISAHPHHVSCVADGPLQGTTLNDLCANQAAALFGSAPGRQVKQFPLLIKLLDCHELLSIQVHPNDAKARQLLGEDNGKTEAWVILDAEPTGRIYAGLLPGTTPDILERHLRENTVERCLHSIAPKAGDCVFLPAGTVHAVGGGVLMAEVQQSSDATFRLYDWNRKGSDGKPRQLHIKEALAAINWDAGPVKPLRLANTGTVQRLVDCPYFVMDRFRLAADMDVPWPGQLSIWMVTEGAAELASPAMNYRRVLQRGATVLVPASAKELSWSVVSSAGTASLLGIHLP